MACELISNYDPTNKPLFLKVSFARPHSPYDPPQRYLDMYKDALIPDPAIGDWCGKYAKKLNPEETAQDAPYGNLAMNMHAIPDVIIMPTSLSLTNR